MQSLTQRLPIALCFLFLLARGVSAQGDGTIFLRNPSFEDLPQHSRVPVGWTDCGFPGESAPDIHPDPAREWQVTKRPQDGMTYLGMVVRDVDTYERVGQRLGVPFRGGQCYEMRINLARSETYMSQSRKTGLPENFVTPTKLRVWGGNSVCGELQLLGQSPLVSNFKWQEFRLKLTPEADYSHIVLEAYYEQPILFPYNGNLLLDNVSPIKPIDCDKDLSVPDTEEPVTEDLIAEATPPVNPEDEITITQLPTPRSPSPAPPPPTRTPRAPEEPKVKLGKTEAVVKEGAVFQVEDITFVANSAELQEDSEAALQEIVGFLRANEGVVVEIGGHASYKASPQFAMEISEARAQEVVNYLREHSIGVGRMLPQGYGKARPVCTEDSQDCNRRNQRVEVKILKLKTK